MCAIVSISPRAWSLQALEGGNEATAGMGRDFAEHTQHLDAAAAAWLAHWHRLVELEEAGLLAKKAELWTVAGVLVLKVNKRCFGC